MENTVVQVCEKDILCTQCGDAAPETKFSEWATFQCQRPLRGNQLKILQQGTYLTFCEINILALLLPESLN